MKFSELLDNYLEAKAVLERASDPEYGYAPDQMPAALTENIKNAREALDAAFEKVHTAA